MYHLSLIFFLTPFKIKKPSIRDVAAEFGVLIKVRFLYTCKYKHFKTDEALFYICVFYPYRFTFTIAACDFACFRDPFIL